MHCLEKSPGHALKIYPELYRYFRRLRPAIAHARNFVALDASVLAWLARVPVRMHGKHGRDVSDLRRASSMHQFIRRIYRAFVNHYVARSLDLASYIVDKIHIRSNRVTQIYNGVHSVVFRRADSGLRQPIADCPLVDSDLWIFGTVGRMQLVKNRTTLAPAFVEMIRMRPELRSKLRLVMVGEGPLRARCNAILESTGLSSLAWLPGERKDISDIMRGLDCFVLPSPAEGISNTILEAMASELPVIATNVGGNDELVVAGLTGQIVPVGIPQAIVEWLIDWGSAADNARILGCAGRRRVESELSIKRMMDAYVAVYDRQLVLAKRSDATD